MVRLTVAGVVIAVFGLTTALIVAIDRFALAEGLQVRCAMPELAPDDGYCQWLHKE